MRAARMDKNVRQLVKAAKKDGWVLTNQGKGSHYMLEHPDGRKITVPGSRPKNRGVQNLRALMRREGIKV